MKHLPLILECVAFAALTVGLRQAWWWLVIPAGWVIVLRTFVRLWDYTRPAPGPLKRAKP